MDNVREKTLMKNVGILLPAYNEEKNIGAVVREAKKYLPGAVVVVVDDGSADRTAAIAKKEGAHVISHAGNMGKGEALRSGLAAIRKSFKGVDYIVVADADRQYTIKEAGRLLEPLESGKADFVMGRRNFSTVPFRHVLGNFVWRSFFNMFFGTNLKDTNCGFIAMRRSVAESVSKVLGGGYIIENALLIEALNRGLEVSQVEVSVNYRKISSVPRGVGMVAGVLIFIVDRGIKYRLGRLKK